MTEKEVSAGGMVAATVFALVGTVGVTLTEHRLTPTMSWVWFSVFAIALLTLAGSVVNFDPKRVIK